MAFAFMVITSPHLSIAAERTGDATMLLPAQIVLCRGFAVPNGTLSWYQPSPTSEFYASGFQPAFQAIRCQIKENGMSRIIESATGIEALTFDDVLLQPGHSEI